MLPVRTILHATDFSESSDFAFRLACTLARDYGARLIVLHVAAPPPAAGFAEGILIPEVVQSHEEERRALEAIQPKCAKIVVERRLVEGEAATEILRAARESGADVVMLGTHGRSGLTRLLMGSVAEHVVRQATCPVVTVKPAAHWTAARKTAEPVATAMSGSADARG